MFVKDPHYLKDSLGRLYGFYRWPQPPSTGSRRMEEIIPCRTYASQTLYSIASSGEDPFQNRLMALWLDICQKPWARPRNLEELIADLAELITTGRLKVYREDSLLSNNLD